MSFLGAQDSEEVKAQLHQARVFCLPSITASNGDAEGFGLVVLEAQSCGIPAITSARGGAQEGIEDGMTGRSFEEGDLNEFTKSIQKYLELYYPKISIITRDFVEKNFNISNTTKNLEKIYNDLFQKFNKKHY